MAAKVSATELRPGTKRELAEQRRRLGFVTNDEFVGALLAIASSLQERPAGTIVAIALDDSNRAPLMADSQTASLRTWTGTELDLYRLAQERSGRSGPQIARDGLLLECRRVVALATKAKDAKKTGATRGVRGSRDAELEAAFQDLIKAGIEPTPARLGALAGTGFRPARRWLADPGSGKRLLDAFRGQARGGQRDEAAADETSTPSVETAPPPVAKAGPRKTTPASAKKRRKAR